MYKEQIKDLQVILEVAPTGVFDEDTINKALNYSHDEMIIAWVQKFLNSLDHNVKLGKVKVIDDQSYIVELSGKFDRATKELLVYFQKEYGLIYGDEINVTAQLDRPAWKLIANYINYHNA